LSELLRCLDAFHRTALTIVSGNFQLDNRTKEHWGRLLEDVDGDWLKVAKYKKDAFIAYHSQTEPVAYPFSESIKDCPGRLFNGPIHKALDSVVRKRKQYSRKQKDQRLGAIATINTVRLICPRPGKQKLESTVRATVSSLTTKPTEVLFVSVPAPSKQMRAPCDLQWDEDGCEAKGEEKKEEERMWDVEMDQSRWRIDRDSIQFAIRSTLREVVSRRAWNDGKCLNDTFFPPTRANYDFSVAKGGGVSGFCQDPDINLDDEKVPGGLLPDMTMSAIKEPEVIEVEFEDGEVMQMEVESEEFEAYDMCYKYTKDDLYKQDYAWANVMNRIRGTAESRQVLKPIGLAEPLKVRVITKGSWKVFMALRNLQQFLAKQLRKHPAFVLTGTPVTKEIVSSLGPLRPGEKFLNGDYAAATNNIKSWISRMYVEELCMHLRLDDQLSAMLMDGMVNNWIEDLDGVQHLQESGQPMGFNNSFIGLCICNAALAKIVRAWDDGDCGLAPFTPLSSSRILVNGDDLLMPVTQAGYEVWKVLGEFVGLSPSIGKTYFTDEYAQINSRNFSYEDGEYVDVFSLNMGLLEGAAKKGSHIKDMVLPCALSQLANNYRQLMADAGCLEEKKRIHGLFIGLHKDLLARAEVPWYVPCWAGGLGLTGLYLPSELDRRAMHEIRLNFSKYNPKSLPVQEDAANGEPDKSWYVHQLAADRLPTPDKTFNPEHPGVLPYMIATGKKSIDMLFDSTLSVEDLFKGQSSQNRAWQNLRHNRAIWRKVMKKALPDPLKLKECVERTVYDCFPVTVHLPFGDDSFTLKDPRYECDALCPDGYVVRDE
jgi:hypothetical protein